ncbi:uncharacterized protein LOC127865652 [Dreissena polymorpha]|uniref:uncharacterized protein LOC127865652 n=1 Tax=Dreissena polymorpha TaxID=45954 RepID=UPI002263B5AA|nr:uncharacterized protein LOC127865652 [Dreissena polymorpha]
MDDLSEMTLERFRLWSMHALKVFLSHRNRSVNGTFDELSARAFCVWEENLPVNEKAEQAEQRLLDEYKRKLEVEGEVIPDPFALSSGWKGEGAGMSLWPSVYVTDIAKFLKCSTPNEVVHRLLNEYKQGKAYRYFENGWVKEVYLHTLNESGDKCVLKTKVTPSMSINSKQYDVWVVVRKNSTDQPGGELLSAYCSCTAGMHGTCNHVAGLLFRVEHAVKSGETSKTATSKLSQWNVPKAKPTKKPVKASEIVWRKGHYGKSAANVENEKKKHAMKKLFTPLNKKQVSFVQDPSQLRSDLYSVLKDDIGDSCFAQMFEKTKVTVPTISLPPTLIELAHSLKSSGDNITPELFLTKLAMTEEMRASISQATVDQSHSETWKSQRKGRLTASLFQRVSSRVKTLQQNEAADPTALVSTIMGETDVRPTNAMKHGLALEPEAKRCYTKTAKKKHLKLKTKESGLSVYIKKPYIAASADLEVECQCCGQGICEIKCPDSIKDQVPTVENVKKCEGSKDTNEDPNIGPANCPSSSDASHIAKWKQKTNPTKKEEEASSKIAGVFVRLLWT